MLKMSGVTRTICLHSKFVYTKKIPTLTAKIIVHLVNFTKLEIVFRKISVETNSNFVFERGRVFRFCKFAFVMLAYVQVS